MKRIVRLGLAVAATTVVALGLVFLAPERASPPALERENVTPYRIGEMARESEQIDSRRVMVLDRLLAKDRVADALLRGELTLEQAVERFRHLTANDPAAVAAMRARYGGRGDEMFYRQVLSFARVAAYYHPERAKVVVPRLEVEVSRRFPPARAVQLRVQ
jgi:hypothetical protein